MGLIKKIFGGSPVDEGHVGTSQFQESKAAGDPSRSRNAPRRELVQVVLRDTMRKHAIPSDWIDCRTLSVVTRDHKSGMHVQFLVRKADEQLLEYVHAFQESFWVEMNKFDTRAREWLFSVAWQFDGKATRGFSSVPAVWTDEPGNEAHDTQPPEEDAEDLESDLKALFAIRDAALTQPAGLEPPPTPARFKPKA